MSRAAVFMVSTLLLTTVFESPTRASWPQWRGPSRDGKAASTPKKLSGQSLVPLWRVELGPSYSGPIVTDNHVFTTETMDKEEEVVRAFDRKTGKELWQVKWTGSLSVPFFARENGSWIRSTPACDGECVYVGGIRDVLVCLDAETGSERWRVDFVEQNKSPLPTFGFVSSPLVDGEDLYVQAGGAVRKLEKRTGKEIWHALDDGGGMMGSAFSSPVLATIEGIRQLVVQSRTTLAGLDPDTGNVLWSQEIPAFRGMNILTPTVIGSSIFTSAYGGRSLLFDVVKSANGFELRQRWTNKVQGYMSSPIVIDGHLYMHLRNQRAACIEIETGKEKWISREHFGKYWSMIADEERILALDETGELYLFRPNPSKFDLIESRKISDEPTWAHVAISGNELYIRELNALAAYRLQDE